MIEADLLLITSEAESLGLPLYEAMEVGLSVIAPDLPYVRCVGEGSVLLRWLS
jgi:glycosyltransferase involved in cell wall biosynthesis